MKRAALKSIPLRTLLREPLKVKRLTRAGQSLRITDNGRPLWILKAADVTDDTERLAAVNQILDEVLREPLSNLSLSKIIRDSRR